ncbi:hypothetical protein PAAG_07123 [Paracoccidioides lutzii Pb01]|uniref:Myb-like domain-containing protein n=1 Tax=Paracoccidioides lutzii (strain ATCC MYA-826 / Pb01) TaxID=502779 RepID=C1H8N2_PARBA|nr:hypothetical protein PAAG_07123 [Paracoccidioides lutzii Pb01]EEH36705.2 hypothetical protein PAAG_07123 [Paracoccidioides lutzii Pb01]
MPGSFERNWTSSGEGCGATFAPTRQAMDVAGRYSHPAWVTFWCYVCGSCGEGRAGIQWLTMFGEPDAHRLALSGCRFFWPTSLFEGIGRMERAIARAVETVDKWSPFPRGFTTAVPMNYARSPSLLRTCTVTGTTCARESPTPLPYTLYIQISPDCPCTLYQPSSTLPPLPPRPPSSSRLSHVQPSPPFKDHHEVQSRAGDSRPNDFDEFFAGLDAADLNPSLCPPIPSDADVERSSRCLNDERHGPHGFPVGDEDRGQEKNDESLPVPLPAVECGLAESTGTKTVPGHGSLTPVLDSIPQAGLSEPWSDQDASHRREWPRSSQGDDPLPFDPPIMVDSGDSTADGSIVDSNFTSPAKRGTSSLPVPCNLWVAVEVLVIADRLEEGMLSSMPYENGLSSGLRTHQRRARARSRRGVPATEEHKLPRKTMQCVEVDMAMSDTDSSSAHSDDTDDDYCASSEEDGPTKPLLKCRRLPTQPSDTTSRCPQFRIPRAAAAADRECVEQEDSRLKLFLEMATGRTMTAAGDTDRYHGERTIDDPDGKRRRWTREEDDRLMALKTDGFSWAEIKERFPRRQLGSLQKRCGSAGDPLPISKPATPLETSHRDPGGQPQRAGDLSTPKTEPHTPSPSSSSTVTVMCPVCNSVVEMEDSSAFNAANNRMPVCKQLRFCENHQKETACRECVLHKKVQKHSRKIISQNVLHSTGYYSLRGHGILSEHVMRHFARDIDSLAGIDSLVSKYGTVVRTDQDRLTANATHTRLRHRVQSKRQQQRWRLKMEEWNLFENPYSDKFSSSESSILTQ